MSTSFGKTNVTHVLPHMRDRRSGLVIFFGSRSVWKPDAVVREGYTHAEENMTHHPDDRILHRLQSSRPWHVLPFSPFVECNLRLCSVQRDAGCRCLALQREGAARRAGALPHGEAAPRAVRAKHHIPMYDTMRTEELEQFNKLWHKAKGDTDRAVEVIVDVARGEGVAAGRELPFWLLLGNATYLNAHAHRVGRDHPRFHKDDGRNRRVVRGRAICSR